MAVNRVSITINSRQYTVVAEESREYIERLGEHINEKVKNVLNGGQNVLGERPIVLAALNICDEYFKALESDDSVKVEIEKLNSKIDNLKKENDSLKRELDDAKSGQVTIDETELNAELTSTKKDLETANKNNKTLEETIKSLKENDIDLILMDVFLPEKSGIDILKAIREKNFFTDVIMITAANSTNEIKRAFAYGVVDYLVKPFEFERFKEAINKYKARKKVLLNEEVVSQSDIDSLIMNNSSENEVKLPKGLNARTLDRIIDFLNEKSNEVWTLREIAYEIKISNVTIKKYMDYLESIGKVDLEMNFGNVGRPEYKYFVKK